MDFLILFGVFFFIFPYFLYSIDAVLNYMVVWLNYKIRADTVEENLWLFTYWTDFQINS